MADQLRIGRELEADPERPGRGPLRSRAAADTGVLWVPHLLLATGTPQPLLVFESTAFATFTLLNPGGATVDGGSIDQRPAVPVGIPHRNGARSFHGCGVWTARHRLHARRRAGAGGQRARAGAVRFFDARARAELRPCRPTPSALLEGIAVSSSGTEAYLQGRNTHNVTFLSIAEAGLDAGMPSIQVDGPPVECLAEVDPMPADYRRGQRLFYSSNSAQFPVTQNFWIACSTCHLEGLTIAVTWKFEQREPRDTPSNAGGPINTGFLFRQAVRNSVIDYDQTIRVEQGGDYSRTDLSQLDDLQALANFTNFAAISHCPRTRRSISMPVSAPHSCMASSCSRKRRLHQCHAGPFFTDKKRLRKSGTRPRRRRSAARHDRLHLQHRSFSGPAEHRHRWWSSSRMSPFDTRRRCAASSRAASTTAVRRA